MVTSDSRVVQILMRVALRSATTTSGAPFVKIGGDLLNLMWFAGSLGFKQVRFTCMWILFVNGSVNIASTLSTQEQYYTQVQSLAREQVLSFWIMYNVLDLSPDWWTAITGELADITVTTMTTSVSNVKASNVHCLLIKLLCVGVSCR